ncbi:MAG: histidine triad nucleotide-binding protein [Gammaproteobacteria bacterium]|nr:MAG: histidine triad nucleotide-binding protein [Gammaproteobacteria bacterium]
MACLFCKIASGEIPAEIIYQDDEMTAFRDIDPQAPTHILIIPSQHIETLNALDPSHAELIGNMTLAAARIAASEGIQQQGYRLVMNCNQDGGQTVFHLHMHLLGGRQMLWPPG